MQNTKKLKIEPNNKNETPIINIITYGLPGKLARQIYNEFQDRNRQINYFIDSKDYNVFDSLKKEKKTIELLLALSIFHKRVILSYEGAIGFYNFLNKQKQDLKAIKIGSYDFSNIEKKKISKIIINYKKLLDKFNLSYYLMDYDETIDFLKNIAFLKSNEKTTKENKNTIPF